jgi:hypothetical protein
MPPAMGIESSAVSSVAATPTRSFPGLFCEKVEAANARSEIKTSRHVRAMGGVYGEWFVEQALVT